MTMVLNMYRYMHLLDGRDEHLNVHKFISRDLEAYMARLNCGKIATVSGRYYAMDPDNRWDRVELAYNAIVHGQGERAHQHVKQYNNL